MNHSHEMEGGTPWIMAAGVAQKTSSQLVPLPDGTLTRARKHTQRTGRRINGGTVQGDQETSRLKQEYSTYKPGGKKVHFEISLAMGVAGPQAAEAIAWGVGNFLVPYIQKKGLAWGAAQSRQPRPTGPVAQPVPFLCACAAPDLTNLSAAASPT
ncbi:uncharacterized protein LOC123443347 [Hordeum vulgare subsp. vulgare]|uniref:uncharacterized protein LOC123443347 n=1 Tax=Hordeum vulgare subsp. vulgare TaxID=112509 RepID=UPI00162BA063|nr:uncharacterized protein LOC123443347 [Hordeum vulgare subsp. vulgare]